MQDGFRMVYTFSVPIQWVLKDEALLHIQTLKTIQDGRTADNTALHNAVQYFESHALASLKDEQHIRYSFIEQIGENYRTAFEDYGDVLISRLKTNPKLTADVYTWANKTGDIRATLKEFFREKECARAKKERPEDGRGRITQQSPSVIGREP